MWVGPDFYPTKAPGLYIVNLKKAEALNQVRYYNLSFSLALNLIFSRVEVVKTI